MTTKKVFVSLFLSAMFVFMGVNFASAEEPEEQAINQAPTATLSPINTTVYAGVVNSWRVGTTSSSGPFTFYYNAGDGSVTKRYDSTTNNRTFTHWYHGYEYVKTYTNYGQVADQFNLSPRVNGSVTVYAY